MKPDSSAGGNGPIRLSLCLIQYARKHRHWVERLDRFDDEEGEWKEVLVEDRRAGPAAIAAARLDFAAWLRRLPVRLREIALTLAGGETTSDAAKQFGVTPGRISQLRQWLKTSWQAFQGELVPAKRPSLTAVA